jgi:hypothetical protein
MTGYLRSSALPPVPSPVAVLTKEINQENKEKGKEKNNF